MFYHYYFTFFICIDQFCWSIAAHFDEKKYPSIMIHETFFFFIVSYTAVTERLTY